ncbi:HD-GYP domain-containing protein [Planctomycetes bacterium K23_9]|uniref:Cyclic di-GMP phosphodiesterase response regulator RpfG n=1 Tax=Stieleria marina TaxID=1930275 RepID=A0A517NY83_9BACT|nr:Cyclic di-GMP phosphodiesterase response regulator RpfG [Planctomycetes bacterium K23_9]
MSNLPGKDFRLETTASASGADLDSRLAEILSAELEVHVQVVNANDDSDCEAIKAAIKTPSVAHVASTDDIATIALRLPAGGVAVWKADVAGSKRSARHGCTILQLEVARHEVHQLTAEVDSLTAQVVNDFEELSLIRSLASSMELPTSGNQLTEFVLSSLGPLAEGVGAISIAGVFTDNQEHRTLEPIWSGEKLLSRDQLNALIDQFSDEASQQTVVRNNLLTGDEFKAANLNEFVMVQCRSEGRLHGWIIACNRIDIDEDVPWAQLGFTTVQASLMDTATNQLAAQLHNMRLLKQKEDLFTEVVRALVNAVEARDPYTCGHSERVASFGRCLAKLSGQSPSDVDRTYLTGLLHDVGKIAIPDGVLQKPGRLDDNERAIIETHTDAGWRILHELEALQDVLPGVLYHHEHFDGEGYPDGLIGDNIPIDGRILAVCDAFDAMTSDRPYRKGMSTEKAAEILKGGAGKFWDPNLINLFLSNLNQFDEIRINHEPREQAVRPAPIDGVPFVGHTTDSLV